MFEPEMGPAKETRGGDTTGPQSSRIGEPTVCPGCRSDRGFTFSLEIG